ncbi:putative glycoside hydrolase [Rubritalea sp.]|uniref:putative glycoside hydrolase n=1 Tax=Rubritalea sp. TaxID=2109375 RepID=UPI003EF35D37
MKSENQGPQGFGRAKGMRGLLSTFSVAVLSVFICANSAVQAEPGYAGEWNKTRLYGHSYSGGNFTDEQYEWIKNHFEYFTVEKPHMRSLYPDPSHEKTSALTATRLIKQNPRCKPLMIYSISAAYCKWFEAENKALKEHPEYFKMNDKGVPTHLNLPLKAENDWYVKTVNSICEKSDLQGIFIDGWRTAVRKHKPNVSYITSKMTGFRLINGFILNQKRNGMYDGLEMLDNVDGVFIDSWFRHTCDSVTAGETMIDTCLQVPNDKMFVCFSAHDGWSKTHEFSHAAYLIVAHEKAYFRWVDEGDHLWNSSSLMTWHDDFGKKIGKPLGKAVKKGHTYHREFEFCTVDLDLENKTSSIVWKSAVDSD